MELIKADIVQFRSIAKETISFDPKLRILVGINESGKTNVLRALHLLSKDSKPKVSDERTVLSEEIEEGPLDSYVDFFFNSSEEATETEKLIKTRIYNSERKALFQKEGESFTIRKISSTIQEVTYKIDISNEKKYFNLNLPDYKDIVVTANLKAITDNCPEDFIFINTKKEEVKIKDYDFLFLSEAEIQNIDDNYIKDVSPKEIIKYIEKTIKETLEQNLPEVLFWEYSPDQLLQSSININDFIENPSICVPLENMFKLAKVENISDILRNKQKRGFTRLSNYLRNIAKINTKYFAQKWKEYDDIQFSLVPEGDNIRCRIDEKNSYEFEDRSDGFKRFVAFLLSISCRNHINTLKNALILVDEPDNGLHPSGVKYFRDELKAISQKNIVICSTHSIFMIDKNNIQRHIIVEKKDEITTMEVAKEGDIAKEEVIFQALKLSLYEILRETNILFEGWRDQALIEAAIRRNSDLSKFYKAIGIGHAQGASTFKNIVPTLELADRKVFIISDVDARALQEQKAYNEIRYKTPWYTYADIDASRKEITGEDFLSKSYVVKIANQLFKNKGIDLTIKENDLPDTDVLACIQRQLSTIMNKEYTHSAIKLIKEKLYSGKLEIKHIKQEYFDLLSSLKSLIETTTAQ